MSGRLLTTFVGGVFLLASTFVTRAAGPDGDLARLWQNPIFKKQLLGSYGINSDVEPPATPEEMSDYEQITRLIPDAPGQAERLIKQILEAKEDASALFDFTLGNIYFQDGRSRQAAEAYISAIQKFPSFRRAHQNLAIIYIKSNYHEPAIKHFTKAIELGGANSTLFGLLGSAYIMGEQPVSAETAFRNAVLLAPRVEDWKLGLVRALIQQEKYAEVISLTKTMIKEDPEDVSLWQLQASAYIGAKDLQNAAANYEVLDELGQIDHEGLNTLGDIYMNSGMHDLAAQAYLRAFRKQPSSTDLDAPLRAAEILAAREAGDQAAGLLAEVREQAGENLTEQQELRILRLQANMAMSQGNRGRAAEMLEEVVKKDPLDGESLLTLGQYHAGKGSPEKAEFYYERAANLEDFTADANVRLAQLYVGNGEYEKAIPLLERAQELKPRASVGDFLEDLERYVKARR